LAPLKVFHMYRNDRAALTWMKEGLAQRMRPETQRNLFRVVDGYYLAVLALALAGARHFGPRAAPGAVAVPLAGAWVTLLHAVLFLGSARFHVPLLPMLSLMAAAEIMAVARWWDARRARVTTPSTA